MKKKIVAIVLLVTTLSFVGCGEEMTNANMENSQVEEEQEVEAVESNAIEEGDMVSEESTILSEDVSSTSAMVDETEPWNGVYGENDAPGLTNIDWDLFNEGMKDMQVTFLGDVNLEINILQVLGSDPRINNDWSALNEKFDTLYGNNSEGMSEFVWDVANSYDYSIDFARGFCDYAMIMIEPYRTNTDNGVYGEITELEITDQVGYDEFYGGREQAAEDAKEKAEQDRWNSLTPEEQQAELYEQELNEYKYKIVNLVYELSNKGIYTEEVWGEFETLYDALDWLISEGYIDDANGKYREAIDYFGNDSKTGWK